MEQPKCPSTNEEIKHAVYIHNRILLSHKKDEVLPFVTSVDRKGIILSEISQMEKDKYHMIPLRCGL